MSEAQQLIEQLDTVEPETLTERLEQVIGSAQQLVTSLNTSVLPLTQSVPIAN